MKRGRAETTGSLQFVFDLRRVERKERKKRGRKQPPYAKMSVGKGILGRKERKKKQKE